MDRYWVGGTGNWDASDTTHWAASSGGVGGQSVPTISDNVFFDSNSGSGIVTASGSREALALDTTGFNGSIAGGATLFAGGNVTIDALTNFELNLTISGTGLIVSYDINTTIGNITLNQATNTLNFASDISCATFTLMAGIVNTNNFDLTATVLSLGSTASRTLNAESSTITVSGSTPNIITCTSTTNLTLNTSNATLVVESTSTTTTNIQLQSSTWAEINISSTSLTVCQLAGAGGTAITVGTLNVSLPEKVKFGGSFFGASVSLTLSNPLKLERLRLTALNVSGATVTAIACVNFGCTGITFVERNRGSLIGS